MTAEIIPLHPKFTEPVRVELSSPGTTNDGRPYYLVDYVDAEGGRCCMYDDGDFDRAMEAAVDCAVGDVPVVDLVNVSMTEH